MSDRPYRRYRKRFRRGSSRDLPSPSPHDSRTTPARTLRAVPTEPGPCTSFVDDFLDQLFGLRERLIGDVIRSLDSLGRLAGRRVFTAVNDADRLAGFHLIA